VVKKQRLGLDRSEPSDTSEGSDLIIATIITATRFKDQELKKRKCMARPQRSTYGISTETNTGRSIGDLTAKT